MNLKIKIKKNLEKMNYDLRNNEKYWKISAGGMTLLKELKSFLPSYCKGKILDAGAGHLLYKSLLTKYSKDYESMDFQKTHPDLTYVTDIQNMSDVNNDRYNFVFSRNVFEHIPYPAKAFSEIWRVLKTGGYAIITVPHLGYLHNEPYDFWRFTKYSLRKLSTDNNFEIIDIKEMGGFIVFQSYIFQTIFMGLTYNIPIIGKIAFWINFLIQKLALVLDKVAGMKKVLPADYLLIIKKKL